MIRRLFLEMSVHGIEGNATLLVKPYSMYAPDKIYKVYAEDYWKSDAWEPLEYAKDYDFSKNFFEQFRILFEEIPHPNMIQKNNVNSEYTNHTLNLKIVIFV